MKIKGIYMITTRRDFLKKSLALGVLASAGASTLKAAQGGKTIKVGYMAPPSLKPEMFDYAKETGFDGAELQSAYKDGKFTLFTSPELMAEFKAASEKTGMPVCSIAAGSYNSFPYVTDDQASEALTQCLDALQYFGAKDLLLPFFVKGSLNDADGLPINEKNFEPLVKKLKAVAPYAEARGLYICIENTLSAKDNIRIIDAVGSPNVRMYYDIANAHRYGYDVPAEIRLLGLKYMKRIHFKDNEGRFNTKNPDVDAAVAACKAIGYKDWIVLERNFEKNNPTPYWQHNIAYTKKAFGEI